MSKATRARPAAKKSVTTRGGLDAPRLLMVLGMVGLVLAIGWVSWTVGPAAVAWRPAPAPVPLPTIVAPGPVPTPFMAGISVAVQEQVRGEFERVKGLETQPNVEPAILGEAYGDLGKLLLSYDLEGSIPALKNAQGLMPGDHRWAYLLGYQSENDGRLEEAVSYYRETVRWAPGDVPARLRMASAYLELGRPDDAAPLLDAVANLEPENPQRYVLSARLASARHDPAAAIAAYEKALALQPRASALYRPLAMAYRDIGDMARSTALLSKSGTRQVGWTDPLVEELDQLRRGAAPLAWRARTLMDKGDLAGALTLYEQAVALDPTNATAHMDLAYARFRMKDLPGAVSAVEQASQLDAEGLEAGQVQRALGFYLERSGDVQGAEAAYLKAIELVPSSAMSQEHLADFYRRLDRCGEAVPHYLQLVALEPKTTLGRLRLSMCQVRLGELAEAVRTLSVAFEAFPDNRDIADGMARLLATVPAESGGDAGRALELAEPLNERWMAPDTMETLAMAYAANGRFADAISWQRQAIDHATVEEWRNALAATLDRYRQQQPAMDPWPVYLLHK